MDKSLKYEYDPHLDFQQFLKEAKTYARHQHKSLASSLHVSEKIGQEEFGERVKPKKSWKTSIFQWLKADKKHSKTVIVDKQPPALKSSFTKSKSTTGGYASGPLNVVKDYTTQRPKRPTSGPLSGLFNQRKKTDEEEFQRPYISLGQFNSSKELRSFGPVYLVT